MMSKFEPIIRSTSRFCSTLLLLLVSGLVMQASAENLKSAAANGIVCDDQWHTMSTVDVAHQFGDYDSLNGVAVFGPADVWAVGQYHVFAGNSYDHTLAEHWDGTSWQVVRAPHPSKKLNLLSGISGTGSKDVWAVGYERDIGIGAPYLTLIEHWDGNAWSIVQDGTYQGVLNSVFALTPDDVWAVGSTDFPGLGVIEHWDGKTWRYQQWISSAEFRAVAALAKNNVWAVGQGYANNGGEDTLAVHFDGAGWKAVPTPNPLQVHPTYDENWLTSVIPLSSTDTWITALWRDTDYGILDHTFSLHSGSTGWQFVPTQNPGGKTMYNDLWASVALSSNEIWAVGSTGQITFSPLIEFWNGAAWQEVAGPSLQGVLMALSRIPSQDAIVASGNQVVGSGGNVYNGTLAEYFCSSTSK